MRIFITLGSQKFPFNRLLKAVDTLVENGKITDSILAQTGYSDYVPVHYPFQPFLDRSRFGEAIDRSDIALTHGGTGVILTAVKKGKKVKRL